MKCVCGFEGHPPQELSDNGKLVSICPSCGRHELPLAVPAIEPALVQITNVQTKPVQNDNLIEMMKVRLNVLEAEILKRRSFEEEARKLRKMLKVAEREESKARPKKMNGAANGATAVKN